jgi:hypothetical protein
LIFRNHFHAVRRNHTPQTVMHERRSVLIIQGHSDSSEDHLCHGLAKRSADGARGASEQTRKKWLARMGEAGRGLKQVS